MGLTHAGVLLLIFCSAYSSRFRSQTGYGKAIINADEEWRKLEIVIDEQTRSELGLRSKADKTILATAASFPLFLRVPKLKYPVAAFKPEKGARDVPEFAKEILKVPFSRHFNNWQPITTAPTQGTVRPKIVEMLCHIDRIYLRIRNDFFKTAGGSKNVQLGTCSSNSRDSIHTYFLYRPSECGFTFETRPDYLSVKNVLQYKPSGNVVREIPFAVPLQCVYHRTFHSYKVGFYPKIRGGTVFKALKPQYSASLVPLDASGKEVSGTKTYILGQQMYFMVKANDTAESENERIYVNKCFMTATQNPSSTPKHVVIDNQGCLVDSTEIKLSKFLPSSSKLLLKFAVAAFVFKDMVATTPSLKKLYMHCEVLVERSTPTSSYKACTYNDAVKVWKELYGDDSVCSCCETSCPSAQPKASRKTISSPSWRVDLSRDGSVDVEPLKADVWEDPDFVEQTDFVNYWEHDD